MRYHAAIEKDGRRIPIFAGRKSVCFKSQQRAIKAIEKSQLGRLARTVSGMRGLVWPAGKTFTDTSWGDIYTISL